MVDNFRVIWDLGNGVKRESGVNRRKTLPVDANQAETQLRDFMKPLLLPVVAVKVEQVHQIAERRPVQRNVGAVRVGHGVVEIVAAAIG